MTEGLHTRAGVLGKPIGHSLSPVIHNAGYVAAELRRWHYTAHECVEADLPRFVDNLDAAWAGLSLTMPLKEVALDVADEVAGVAATIGAANTLVRLADGSWRADNTDAPGMVDALLAAGVTGADRVSLLGAGGTARAALVAAREFAAQTVTVYARRPEAIDELRQVADNLDLNLIGLPFSEANQAGVADVIISTLPKGVGDPLAAQLRWQPGAVLFDAIYDPWPTPLAAAAADAGCHIVSGLDLLLAQAVRQFELFTGVDAPVVAMREALREAAAAR
jgi:shikimate dehydrogenase